MIERSLRAVHVLARRDPDAGQQRISSDGFAHARAEVSHGLRIVSVLRESVLALGAPDEDIPGEPVNVDTAILRVLHDLSPEADLVVDRHVFDNRNLAEIERLRHDLAVHVELQIEWFAIAPHIVERDVGIFGHFHD